MMVTLIHVLAAQYIELLIQRLSILTVTVLIGFIFHECFYGIDDFYLKKFYGSVTDIDLRLNLICVFVLLLFSNTFKNSH